MSANAPGVLVVAARREDRRALFDALDGLGIGEILSARDVDHARSMLGQGATPQLAILDFRDAAAESAALLAELDGVRVIGLLGSREDGGNWDYGAPPPGVVEWLRTPVDAGEARARVRTVLADPSRRIVPAAATQDRADYHFAFERSADEWIVSDARSGEVLEVNPAFELRSGFAAADAVGRPLSQILSSDAALEDPQRARQLEREGHVRYPCDKPRRDGSRYPVEVETSLAARDGRMVHVSVVRDAGVLQQQRALMSALAQALAPEHSLEYAARCLLDGLSLDFLAVLARAPGEEEPALAARVDRLPVPVNAPDPLRQPTALLALGGGSLFHPADAQRMAESDAFVRAFGFESFFALPLLDGHRNVLGALLGAARGEPVLDPALLQGVLQIACARFGAALELQRAQEQGRAGGLLDALTGLPNRLLFNDRLETTIHEAHRSGERFAVLFVDLDRFKNINDSLGHAVGDQVLVAMTRRLRASVRASDTVARYAGDEFTLVLRHITQREDVLRIAEKLVRTMEAPLTLQDGSELRITTSIGISFYPDDALDAERLVKFADVAMYNAKGMGRNNYQTYVAMPEESHRQRIELEARLREAERNGELRVYYQPQVDARSEDIVGMEALVRWEHPQLGLISPAFFIPLAEETGLIIPIGEWVLRQACHDALRWQRRFDLPLRIGVNLSALQLMQPNLLSVLRAALDESGLAPGALDLEVTESISMKSVPNLLDTLAGLHDLGCGISIDDFGTGQSSLDYLKRFPADRIKIDQSFVRNIGVDSGDEAIVRATLGMAHNLGRKVVAEGVEIEAHLEFLREHGCEELQGYLFCRPLPAAAFERLLAERAAMFGSAVAEA